MTPKRRPSKWPTSRAPRIGGSWKLLELEAPGKSVRPGKTSRSRTSPTRSDFRT
jgi:hypothetical protein